jgi:hypothetical protein
MHYCCVQMHIIMQTCMDRHACIHILRSTCTHSHVPVRAQPAAGRRWRTAEPTLCVVTRRHSQLLPPTQLPDRARLSFPTASCMGQRQQVSKHVRSMPMQSVMKPANPRHISHARQWPQANGVQQCRHCPTPSKLKRAYGYTFRQRSQLHSHCTASSRHTCPPPPAEER